MMPQQPTSREFGVSEIHDRPLILQHTLQDFIFMRPKARYEVLSAMLGLEPLIALRGAIEAAKTEFSKRLPARVQQAQNRSFENRSTKYRRSGRSASAWKHV